MTRKSIAIDMDEVLADTVGALLDDVNKRTDLGITYEMLDGIKLRHAMPEQSETDRSPDGCLRGRKQGYAPGLYRKYYNKRLQWREIRQRNMAGYAFRPL